MDRVFLDANVLFTAAYRDGAGLLRLWELEGVELVASLYVLEEARRNLRHHRPDRLPILETLLQRVRVTDALPVGLPLSVALHEKDRPVLLAALALGATHLLTGDKKHFGALFGRTVGGVLVLLPAAYLSGNPPRAH